jgi:hypothetical protein
MTIGIKKVFVLNPCKTEIIFYWHEIRKRETKFK